MKTIPTILPIYDSIEKQDQTRTGTKMPVLTPRYRLPSFQWNVQSSNPGNIGYIELIESGKTTAIDITSKFHTSAAYIQDGGGAGWVNNVAGYDTFTSVNKDITSAIKTTAAGRASSWNQVVLLSVEAGIVIGEVIIVKAVLTLNSGTAPKMRLERTDTGASISNEVQLVAGTNYIYLTCTSTIASGWAITFFNGDTELCNWSSVNTYGNKTIMPKLFTSLTDDYFQYKGNTLGQLLPRGTYYMKLYSQSGYQYYSDLFTVTDIYENLITSFTNGDYDTFTKSGTTITSAINAAGNADALSSNLTGGVNKGDVITMYCFLTKTSGQLPSVYIRDNGTGNSISGAGQALITGLNVITFTIDSSIANCQLKLYNTAAGSFSITEVIIIRSYSASFIKLDFHDTHDLGEILYQDGFTQTAFLEAKLAPPTHEVVEVGEEKNGIFITEKIITKYKYRIIANIGRELYKALLRLPQHDSITITDDVGNTYTPAVGNVQVIPANWIYYDVCRIEIIFNDNTEYIWTSENNNIT